MSSKVAITLGCESNYEGLIIEFREINEKRLMEIRVKNDPDESSEDVHHLMAIDEDDVKALSNWLIKQLEGK